MKKEGVQRHDSVVLLFFCSARVFLVGVCLMQGEIFIEIKYQYVVILNNNRYNEIKTYEKEVKCDE
jgi:hypothetical protein